MDRKQYRRYFIILDHEDKGFQNKEGKMPKGYTKIETRNGKGVLNHYIENMKYFEDAEYMYKGYLIGTKNHICIENGTFMMDQDGKGELSWKFDPDNVDGKGHSITDFNVIAIMAKPREIEKEVATPLVGFIDKKKVAFKHVVEENQKKSSDLEKTPATQSIDKVKEETIVKEEKVETKEEDLYKQDTEQKEVEEEKKDIEEKKDTVEKEDIKIEQNQEIYKESEEIEKEEVQNKDYPKDLQEEEKEEMEEKIMRNTQDNDKENKQKVEEYSYHQRIINGFRRYEENEYAQESNAMKAYDCKNPYEYYQQYFKMVSGYVENILKYYPIVEPFEKNMKNCTWWKIDCSQQTLYRNFLPFYGYTNYMYTYIPYTPYTSACPPSIYKYKHYIFGIMKNEKGEVAYYLYGVPGRFIKNEQPYEGKTGFVYWHSLEDKKAEKGDYGYWILHIDAKTGNAVVPPNKTIPPQ
ncbi:hypothetical protein [Inediibacterium massiliense]|uniref:DUF7922 domain-containing protein n=1 Tax=Inediibacterium massiliense TaxID=1658111 RepID=UPI0006B436CB|nr:hypothetical protein [Inediibacterium massiliense]